MVRNNRVNIKNNMMPNIISMIWVGNLCKLSVDNWLIIPYS